jgi:hypothetical protein
VGNAFHFDGSSFINLGSATGQFGTGPFSLEAWFLWDGGGSSVRNIFRKSNFPVSTPGTGYWVRITGSGLEFFAGETVGISGFPRASVSVEIAAGSWHHVVATKDSSGLMTLYLDGQPAGIANLDPTYDLSSSAPFTLGAWDDRFGIVELFSGYMDEISTYTRALTANEVQLLFQAGAAGKCM